MKIDNQDEFQMFECNYNEIGQLIEKNLHRGGNWDLLQSIDYSYNIRGWMKGINIRSNNNDANDVFNMELFYDDATSTLNHSPQYNGNISGNLWWHFGREFIQGYGYEYDNVNRLTKARYGEKTEQSNWNINEKYSLQNVGYDANGNIKELKRNGLCGQNYGIMDDLTYVYSNSDKSNNLEMVFDAGSMYYGFKEIVSGLTEYFYDNNGNMIRDRNKGILDIKYNHLNLPEKIEIENNRRIQYLYDANGTKLRKLYFEDNRLVETTDYSDIFVYNDHLDYVLTSEGRLKWNDHDLIFYAEYFIRDHLGSVRSVISTDPNQHFSTQATDYYPFGMEIPVYGNDDYNQLKYNGKELQTAADLTWYDYGARFYDPQLGRWHTIDAYAEKYFNLSPYQYGANNPVCNIDINGDSTWVTTTEKTITIHTSIEFSGKAIYKKDGSLKKNAQYKIDAIKNDITSKWNGIYLDGKEVTVDLITTNSSTGNTERSYDQIELKNGSGQTKTTISDQDGNIIPPSQGIQFMIDLANGTAKDYNVSGVFYLNTPSGTFAHEYGHMAGYQREEYKQNPDGSPKLNIIEFRDPIEPTETYINSIMFSPIGNTRPLPLHIRAIMDVNKTDGK